jgi:hypothetical protein
MPENLQKQIRDMHASGIPAQPSPTNWGFDYLHRVAVLATKHRKVPHIDGYGALLKTNHLHRHEPANAKRNLRYGQPVIFIYLPCETVF